MRGDVLFSCFFVHGNGDDGEKVLMLVNCVLR